MWHSQGSQVVDEVPALRSTGNIILRTDSYRFTHWKQYPPGVVDAMLHAAQKAGFSADNIAFGST